MKIHVAPIAPNPRRVLWVMAEKEISDIEVETYNLGEGRHKQVGYLQKAGLPVLPMLELDDGTAITESLAICRYLESRWPEPNLFGTTPEETAVIEMWTRRAEMNVAIPLMVGVRHTFPPLAALEKQDPLIGAFNLEDTGPATGQDRVAGGGPVLDCRYRRLHRPGFRPAGKGEAGRDAQAPDPLDRGHAGAARGDDQCTATRLIA
jgi:glutathione S-transferase